MIEHVQYSGFSSKHDSVPKRKTEPWSKFCLNYAKPRRTTCTQATCKYSDCPHKNGKAFSLAVYPAGSSRQKKNVIEVFGLVVDVDHRSDLAALKHISQYQYLAHSSHSDRSGNPNAPCTCGSEAGALHGTNCPARVDRCIRIILATSRPVTRDEWPRFWRAAMRKLEMPADPATCDANRLYYLPSRPADADYFFITNEGIAVDVDEILASAPIEPIPSESSLGSVTDLHPDEHGGVGKGERHALLKSIAGKLRHSGAGEEEILAGLRAANQARCNPPKPEEELQRLAKWAVDQPPSSLPPPEVDPRRPVPIDSEAQPDGPSDEQEDFIRDKRGSVLSTQGNVVLALRKLGVQVTFDELSGFEIIKGLAGHGPRLDDAAVNCLRWTIEEQFGFEIPKEKIFDLISHRARLHSFHPIRLYLNALKWDGEPRIDRWLVDYAGAPDTTYTRAVGRIVLIAAVRRVRQPGCKFDEMLILESPQGWEKSSSLRVLAVDDAWFADHLPLDGDIKHFMEATAGKWIVEAGELRGMSKADVAALKECLSRQIDESRLAYGRKTQAVPRQFVIIGTTNETSGYLRDLTGNRRFWPIRVQRINLEKLRRDRDQLWAEASLVEASGEAIRLDPSLYEEAAIEQEARTRDEDPLVDALGRNLGSLTGKLRIADAYLAAGIEPSRATQDQMSRFQQAIRTLGWEKARRRMGGERCFAYVRGNEDEREVELAVECDPMTRAVKITPLPKKGPGGKVVMEQNN